jgi:hypothetical protein
MYKVKSILLRVPILHAFIYLRPTSQGINTNLNLVLNVWLMLLSQKRLNIVNFIS